MKLVILFGFVFILVNCQDHVTEETQSDLTTAEDYVTTITGDSTTEEDSSEILAPITLFPVDESYDITSTEASPEESSSTEISTPATNTSEEEKYYKKSKRYVDTIVSEETPIETTPKIIETTPEIIETTTKIIKTATPQLIDLGIPNQEQAESFMDSIYKTIQEFAKRMGMKLTNLYEDFLEPLPETTTTPPQKKRRKRTISCSSRHPQCFQEGLFRLNTSCTKYYECSFNARCNKLVSKIRTCPRCLKFNALKMKCDLPQNVPECAYLSNSPNKFCTATGKYFVPDDCSKYYNCQKDTNGTVINLTVENCDNGMIFSQKDQTCVKRKSCNRHLPKCGPGKFYLSDKFDCGSFHYCITDDTSASLQCPPNSIFDGQNCESWEKSKLNWEKNKKR